MKRRMDKSSSEDEREDNQNEINLSLDEIIQRRNANVQANVNEANERILQDNLEAKRFSYGLGAHPHDWVPCKHQRYDGSPPFWRMQCNLCHVYGHRDTNCGLTTSYGRRFCSVCTRPGHHALFCTIRIQAFNAMKSAKYIGPETREDDPNALAADINPEYSPQVQERPYHEYADRTIRPLPPHLRPPLHLRLMGEYFEISYYNNWWKAKIESKKRAAARNSTMDWSNVVVPVVEPDMSGEEAANFNSVLNMKLEAARKESGKTARKVSSKKSHTVVSGEFSGSEASTSSMEPYHVTPLSSRPAFQGCDTGARPKTPKEKNNKKKDNENSIEQMVAGIVDNFNEQHGIAASVEAMYDLEERVMRRLAVFERQMVSFQERFTRLAMLLETLIKKEKDN